MFSVPCVAFLFDSVGMGNIIVLFLVILIVVGPKRLPEVARKLGRMMDTFRRAADEFKAQIMTIDQEPPAQQEQPSNPSDTPTDQDGVPQSSSEPAATPSSGDGEAYKNPYENSPYPGNEQYMAGWNQQEQTPETEAPPSPTPEPVSESIPPTPPEQPEAAAETQPESERVS